MPSPSDTSSNAAPDLHGVATAMRPGAADWLAHCQLPQAWAQQPHWRVLAVEADHGLPFLQCWQAWRADPQRPQTLHFTAVIRAPWDCAALAASLASNPELHPLAQALAQRCTGLLPGVHRLGFEAGRVLLTLWIGDTLSLLRQQTTTADSIYLPAARSTAPAIAWDAQSLKALARHCQRGTVLLAAPDIELLHAACTQTGFEVQPLSATPSSTAWIQACYQPRWQPRVRTAAGPAPHAQPGTALVIGAGLAGSAVAHSLALRGWHVQVLAQGSAPADGASGLPAGLFCPHVSPDDSVLSRLSRSGVRLTLQRLRDLCQEGQDWGLSGVLEHCTEGGTGLPSSWQHTPEQAWSQPCPPAQQQAAGLPDGATAYWHTQAGWVRPAQLVAAQLAHPRIRFVPHCHVAQLTHSAEGLWQALDADHNVQASATLAVLACGPATAALLPASVNWTLQALRGQVTWGWHTDDNAAALPPFPVNGNGNLVPHVPADGGNFWVMGSTFERDVAALPIPASEQAQAHAVNYDKLRALLPHSAPMLMPWFTPGSARCLPTWGQVRCASYDRLPIAGPVTPEAPNLWACTAMGARGLTLSVLCAELLAAQLHGEPLPLDQKLALHLGTPRLARQREH